MSDCELCETPGGEILWRNAACRVVRVGGTEGAAFPGFCRVIWQAHVREMSDLTATDRNHLLDVVDAVETVVRNCVKPDKINLASFGNLVPHLHWHVIPRWADDSHFPAPIWAVARRAVPNRPLPDTTVLTAALAARLGEPCDDLS